MKPKYRIKVTHKLKLLWYIKIIPRGGGYTTFTSQIFSSHSKATRAAKTLADDTGWLLDDKL